MPVEKLSLAGADFARLIKAVTVFPASAADPGAAAISLSAGSGRLTASRMGIGISLGNVPADGSELALVGLNDVQLAAFASLCGPDSSVKIVADDQQVTFIRRGKETKAGRLPGARRTLPDTSKWQQVGRISEDVANRLRYLSQVAFSDDSRPELACVMLTGDRTAVAVNQRVVAVLDIGYVGQPAALPIPLAAILNGDDRIVIGPDQTAIRNNGITHCMPSVVQAAKNFPVQTVLGYAKIKTRPVAWCRGEALAQAINECDSVLGALAKTSMAIELSEKEGRLNLSASNAGARFRAVIPTLRKTGADLLARIPLDGIKQMAGFLVSEEQIDIVIGESGGETILRFKTGFLLFPSWQG